MNGYEQALLFNNHGVALLASGSNEQREAIAKFRCALAVIKAGIIDESKKVGGENKHSSYSNEKSTSFHSSQRRGREPPRTTDPPPYTTCNHNHYDGDTDTHDDNEQEPASNRNIQLNIQDFLEPIVIPFPDSCNSSGEDGDFFLYRHAFIISRSSAFSPSWEHSKEAVAADVTTSPQQRKRSFPGAETLSTTMNKNGHTGGRMSPQVLSSSSAKNDPMSIVQPPTYVVDDPQEKCGSYSPLSLDLLSSVVVFNMALAHNVEEASQRRYRVAIAVDSVLEGQRRSNLAALNDVSRRLYDMSIGLLSTVLRAKEVSKSVIEAMVVLAASSNNLAKILFDEGHIQTARSTLKTLWYTTSWICEKVLLPQQEAKVSLSPWGEQQEQRSSTMTMSHVMPRPGPSVSTPMMMITTLQPQNQASSSHNDVAGVMGNRNPFDEIDGNFLARTPGRERTTTASAFLFSESDIEGFIMNVMLMYHSQPPIVAKAA